MSLLQNNVRGHKVNKACAHVCVRVCMSVHAFMHTRVHITVHTCMIVCVGVYMCVYVHVHLCIWVCLFMHMYVCAHMRVCIHVPIHGIWCSHSRPEEILYWRPRGELEAVPVDPARSPGWEPWRAPRGQRFSSLLSLPFHPVKGLKAALWVSCGPCRLLVFAMLLSNTFWDPLLSVQKVKTTCHNCASSSPILNGDEVHLQPKALAVP